MTRAEHWTVGVLALAAAAIVVRLLDAGPPVQPIVMAAFLVIAPGASVLGGAPGWSWLLWLTAVVATSLSIAIVVATALLFAGWWDPDRVLAVLVVTCLVGAAGHHLRRPAVVR